VTTTDLPPLDRRHQATVGVALAAAIIGAWATLHIYALFFFAWTPAEVIAAPVLVLVLTWLYVGLFIIAHDCMHGSLVPFRPAWNRAIGRLCLFLYAGFSFDALNPKHHLHHRHAGTGGDPDFHDHEPHAFWPWYVKFFSEYFTGRELIAIIAINLFYLVLGVPLPNILLFWALPAVLSSLQLFTFGTYLPHKPADPAFSDRHRSRSNDYPWIVSLLTCFHFGYHHEHHLYPGVPWWRLPAARQARRAAEAAAH
jgi:beta-carotene ketolase (CrtW type)